jgi:signal transduction histidine kinase
LSNAAQPRRRRRSTRSKKRVELEAVKAELAVPEEQPVSETPVVNVHAMLEEAREQAERDRIGRELRPQDEPT